MAVAVPRRLECIAAHVVVTAPATVASPTPPGPQHPVDVQPPLQAAHSADDDRTELARLFGAHVRCETGLMASGGGLRLAGLDLARRLSPPQAAFLVGALARHRLASSHRQALPLPPSPVSCRHTPFRCQGGGAAR